MTRHLCILAISISGVAYQRRMPRLKKKSSQNHNTSLSLVIKSNSVVVYCCHIQRSDTCKSCPYRSVYGRWKTGPAASTKDDHRRFPPVIAANLRKSQEGRQKKGETPRGGNKSSKPETKPSKKHNTTRCFIARPPKEVPSLETRTLF